MSKKQSGAKTPPKPAKKPGLVAIGKAARMLGLTDGVLLRLAQIHGCRFGHDSSGRPALTREDVERLASVQDYPLALRQSLAAEQRQRARMARMARIADEALVRQRGLIEEFEGYCAELEAIHRRQLAAVNAAGPESPAMAAYLLLSKAIALLRMLTLSLAHQHWYAGVLLRDIDECLDAATYFAFHGHEEAGAKALQRWFRLNESPPHATLRAAGAELFGQTLGDGNHRDVLDELYQLKSKWTHPTYQPIREVARYDVANGVTLVEPSYGPCNEPERIRDLTQYARSSFWSTYQALWLALQRTGVLAPAEVERLQQRDHAFQSAIDDDRRSGPPQRLVDHSSAP